MSYDLLDLKNEYAEEAAYEERWDAFNRLSDQDKLNLIAQNNIDSSEIDNVEMDKSQFSRTLTEILTNSDIIIY